MLEVRDLIELVLGLLFFGLEHWDHVEPDLDLLFLSEAVSLLGGLLHLLEPVCSVRGCLLLGLHEDVLVADRQSGKGVSAQTPERVTCTGGGWLGGFAHLKRHQALQLVEGVRIE